MDSAGLDTLETVDAEMEVDFLVVGGGMAGMSAAAYAAHQGATVLLVERAPEIGGSAVLSAGGVWAPMSIEQFSALNPGGDTALLTMLTDGYAEGIAWIRSLDVHVDPPARLDEIMGFPAISHAIDILSYIHMCRATISHAGGWVVTNSEVRALRVKNGKVMGALVHDHDGLSKVRAQATLLATGGFPSNSELRGELIGEHARTLLERTNGYSDGSGLALARRLGAAISPAVEQFYGHSIATPRAHAFPPGKYVLLAQLYSHQAILLDRTGSRFTDESFTYYRNALAISKQPSQRALLIGDQAIRDQDIARPGPSGGVDRLIEAMRAGAHAAQAATLDVLDNIAAGWGYRGAAEAVRKFNSDLITDPENLKPPRRRSRRALDQAPWFLIEVEPAITSTWRGLRTDSQTRVLDTSNNPISGLLAAGSDVGGVYAEAYGGGLSMALVSGLRAAKTALAHLEISSAAR